MKYFTSFLILLFLLPLANAQTTSLRYEGRLSGPSITTGSMPGQSFTVSIRRPDLCGGNLGLTPANLTVSLENGAFSLSPTFNSNLLARAMDPYNDFSAACSTPYFARQMVITWGAETFAVNMDDSARANFATYAMNSAKIGNVAVQTNLTCSSGQVLKFNSAGPQFECQSLVAADIPILSAAQVPALAGDVSGTVNATSVDRIKGIAVNGVPTTNQVLKYNGTNWAPAADSTGVASDATYAAKGLVQIDTTPAVSGLALTAGVLKLSNTSVTAGTYGNSLSTLQIQVDSQGRIQSLSQVAVDDTTKLPLAGGSMTGNINLGGHDLLNSVNVAATNASVRNLVLNDNDANTVTLRTPADVIANYTLVMPPNDGNAGEFLTTDGSGTLTWTAAGGGGITSLGGLTGSAQSFAVGTAGTTPNISSVGAIHTFNFPSAATGGVTSGTISNSDYTTFNTKLTSPSTTKGDLIGHNGITHVRLPAGTDGQTLFADSSQASGLRWGVSANGTVTSVTSANAYIGVANSSTTPILTANVGTVANTLAAGDDTRIVNAIQASAYLADVNAASTCTTAQTPYWFSVGDVWACQNIANLNASVITAGTINPARLGGGTADATTFLRGDGIWATAGAPDTFDSYAVRVATTGNITLASLQTIDGITLLAGERVLVKNQVTASQNGIYVAAAGAWTRANDMDNWNETIGYNAIVKEGTLYAGARFSSATTTGGAINSTAIEWNSESSFASNSAFGYRALRSTSGANNVAIGMNALQNSTSATNNTAVGSSALSSATTGSGNTALGNQTLAAVTTATGNTAVGNSAGTAITTGISNTFIGKNAGSAVTIGSNNVIVGGNTGSTIASLSNFILLSDGIGNERLRVDNTGNVGIGTTTPSTILDINGALTTRGIASPAVSSAGQGRLYFDSTSNTFKVSQNGGAYVDLMGSAGDITDVIAGTGLTGGASSGAATLNVDFTGTNAAIRNQGNTLSGNMVIGNLNSFGLDLMTNATTRFSIDANGNTAVGAAPLSNVRLNVNGGIGFVGISTPPPTGANEGRIYFDNLSHRLKISEDGNAYSPVLTDATAAADYVSNTFFNSTIALASCSATQTAYWNSINTRWECQNIDSTNAGGFVREGGNFFGIDMTIGTNSFNSLNFETNGGTKMTILPDGKTGIGTSTPVATLNVVSPTFNGSGNAEGSHFTSNVSQSTSHTGTYSGTITEMQLNGTQPINFAFNADMKMTNNSSSAVSDAATLNVTTGKTGTGTTTSQKGIGNNLISYVGTISNATGLFNTVDASSIANVNNAVGISSQVTNSSSNPMTTALALVGKVSGNSNNIGTAIGLEVGVNTSGGTITNAYGINIGAIAGTNRFGIYQSDSAAKNAFLGNFGIGTTTPNYKLDVLGDVNINASNYMRFGGTIVCQLSGCTAVSDARYKENVEALDHSLEKILRLQGVEYDWINKEKFGDKHQIGFIAQDLEKEFPEVVYTDKQTGYKSVAYDHLVAPIVEAIKSLVAKFQNIEQKQSDQARQIASIKEENEKLKQENAEIKARLEKIEKSLSKK